MGRPDWQCWPEGERCITCYRPVTDGELCPCGCGRMVCVEHRQPQHSPTPTPAERCGAGHLCCNEPDSPPLHDHFLTPADCPACGYAEAEGTADSTQEPSDADR